MKNIDIDINIDMVILENIVDMDFLENIDIDKGILKNIDIDKILYRLKFGISNRATALGAAAQAHFWPKNLHFLRYTHITPIFRAQAGPTQ